MIVLVAYKYEERKTTVLNAKRNNICGKKQRVAAKKRRNEKWVILIF